MAEDRRFSPEYGRRLRAELAERREELEEREADMLAATSGELERAMEGWKLAKVRLAKTEKEMEYYEKHRIVRVNNNKETLEWARKGV